MDFTVTIEDPAHLAGITWAREEYNKTVVPPPPEAEGEDPPPAPTLDTDADYVQWVMAHAAASYADQKYRAETLTAAEAGRAA